MVDAVEEAIVAAAIATLRRRADRQQAIAKSWTVHGERGTVVVSGEGRIADALDCIRFEEIAELAERAASYWISIREAADRRERLTVETHCRQVRLVTLAAFETVKALGSQEAA